MGEQVAWLTVHTNKAAVSELMRIVWRTVSCICKPVTAEQLNGATCTRA